MNIPAAPTVHTARDTYSLVLAGSAVEGMSMIAVPVHNVPCFCTTPIMSGYEQSVVNIPSFDVLAPCPTT